MNARFFELLAVADGATSYISLPEKRDLYLNKVELVASTGNGHYVFYVYQGSLAKENIS